MRRLALLAALILAVTPIAACAQDEEEPEEGQVSLTVEAFDFHFDPTTIVLDLGAPVELSLQNGGGARHSFTAPDLDVNVEADSGESSTISFTAPGEPGAFDFFCEYHPDEMTGTVSVGGEPGEVPPAGEVGEGEEEDEEEDVEVEVETEGTP